MNHKEREDKIMTLTEAVRKFVVDDYSLTLCGFCGRNSQAAAHEIIRQKKRSITVIDDSPTDQLDILIGAGCVKKWKSRGMAYQYSLRRKIFADPWRKECLGLLRWKTTLTTQWP